mgnify:CR=1 FL=1
MTSRAGIVLAGGYARRFEDGDKTLADFEERPLIAHAVDALRPVVDTVVVSCRDEQIESFERVLDDVIYAPDPEPDEGPLAGLAAALAKVDATAVAVTTADRPRVPTGLYRQFFQRLASDGIVIEADDIRQPAPAVFATVALREAVNQQRDSGERRLRSVFELLDLDIVSSESVAEQWGEEVLIDVNTAADLKQLGE